MCTMPVHRLQETAHRFQDHLRGNTAGDHIALLDAVQARLEDDTDEIEEHLLLACQMYTMIKAIAW